MISAAMLAVAGLSVAGIGQTPRVLAAIRDSAGVRVVSNVGDTDPVMFRPVEELRIGVVSGDTSYQFDRVGQIAVDRQGRVYAAQGAMSIRVFGPDGKLIRSIGRRGQGPGEFTSIDRLWFAGDTLVVSSPRRATLFSPTGQVLVAWDLRLADEGRAELLARRPSGWLAWVRPKSREGSLAPAALFRDTLELRMYDPIAKLPTGPPLRRQAGQRAAALAELYPGGPLFEPRSVTAIGADGTQYHSEDGQYTIDVFDPGGLHVRRIIRPVAKRPITQGHVRMLNDFLDSPPAAGGRPRAPRGGEQRRGVELAEKYPLASSFAVVGAMLVARDGSLLVQRMDDVDPIELEWMAGFDAGNRSTALIARRPTRWERFDADGRYLGAVMLPARFQPRHYDGRRVTGVLRDADGVEFVVRQRLDPA
jgi:hypothetical protein